MKSVSEIKLLLLSNKQDLVKKYSLKSLALFGSFVRDEATENSDLDILVEFDKPIGLDFV
ncbi:MAG: nucleotidyltransferase domain-containing protein, partial [Ignavibacteria bacterium]|nr:nucleotidyltransferase domain-containing protein [Ignavibacteria bacterium]